MGCTGGKLYFFPLGQGEDSLVVINPNTLAVEEKVELEGKQSPVEAAGSYQAILVGAIPFSSPPCS